MNPKKDTNQKAIDALNRTSGSPAPATPGTGAASSPIHTNFDPRKNGVPVQPEDPGHTLGIIGFCLSLAGIFSWGFTAIPGTIVSFIGLRSSKKAGFTNGLAIAGTIIGLGILMIAALIITLLATNEDFREGFNEPEQRQQQIEEDYRLLEEQQA